MSTARLMQMAAAGVDAGGGDVWTDPDLTNASYDSVSFSGATQSSGMNTFSFGYEGSRLYMVDSTNDTIYQYNLTTPYDISTASYSTKSFSVATQEGSPAGIYFKPDGQTVFVGGYSSDTIYQYSLSTAWDISSASYASKSFSVSAQETVPRNFWVNSAGTKLFSVGQTGDDVNEYTLSSPWDISTASYTQNFSVATQDTTPIGIYFSPAGDKMFIAGSVVDSVYQYTLSTALDISTASYDSIAFSISGQTASPVGVAFNGTGSKMYVVGATNDTIYQYSTAASSWTDPDLANAGYDSVNFDVVQDAAPFDCFFKPDGTKMYVVGQGNDALYQYSLSTAWDLSSASYDSVSFSLSTQDTSTLGVFFKPDGTKFYIVGNINNSVFEYSLSTAWDISTASYSTNSFSVTSQDATPGGVFFKDDGSKMYVVGLAGDSVYQYSLSTNWNVSTASYDTKSVSTSPQSETNPSGLFINPQGTKIWVSGTANDTVAQYSMSTAWDLSTASYDSIALSVGPLLGGPRGFFFKPDGAKMYIVNSNNDTIYQYSTD